MTSYFLTLVFLLLSSLPLNADEETVLKRVNAHMVIGDFSSACQEAMNGLHQYPEAKPLWLSYIRALSKTRDEKTLIAHWSIFVEHFPAERQNREILECLAWAVIDNGSLSSSPIVRVTALLGAFFSQDAKGVAILLKGLRDEHAGLRGASIKLSSMLRDASLQDEILHLLKTEKSWKVRLEAIEVIGELHMTDARKELLSIIAQNNTHIEEKVAAITALVTMSDEIDHCQLIRLVQSDRVGMRLLACEMIAHYQQAQDIDLLYPLLKDYHADVRAKVFETIGRLRIKQIAGQNVTELAENGTTDNDPHVAVTSAWVLTLNDSTRGQKAFVNLLQHQSIEIRHLASAALAATGKYGMPLTLTAFQEQNDPYVKMNLALGLIGQRINSLPASDCLYDGLTQQKERWAWKEEGNFRILAPSKVKHDEAIPNYPEAVNQLTRLDVLEVLAMVHHPKAQQAIKSFLQERHWGISGIAAALLLTEGDEDAVDLVKQLLNDPDQKVKVQAALILAMWGQGEDVVAFLQSSYAGADRELKGQILEGIGRVGSNSSLGFLVEKLQEPFQTLRIAAAAALLECLYH